MGHLESRRLRLYYRKHEPLSYGLQEIRDNMTPEQRAQIDQDFLDEIKDNTPVVLKTDDSWLESQRLKELVTTEHGIKYINSEINLNQYLDYEKSTSIPY